MGKPPTPPQLNSLAGRSFNDLTQYPVFPWVLADYESAELDLGDPGVYRDLSRPMGAIGAARAAQFRERYEAQAMFFDPNDGTPPPFHYGTHYSCSAYVLHYLVRLEPYARLSMQLQGGSFDKPDRLFRDIAASWRSASSENLQDVRELIPEFYCLPEFLANADQFELGHTQRGVSVHDVRLPPWARGDPREFVRVMRQALESPYVSAHLHEWIDLVFGCKQRGPAAAEAQNLFVHVTYEGEVDIDAIDDPVTREATIAQIQNFGQTPSRLFKGPHPKRHAHDAALHTPVPLAVPGSLAAAGPGGAPVQLRHTVLTRSGGGPVGDVRVYKDRVHAVGADCMLVPPHYTKYLSFNEPHCGVAFRTQIPTPRHREVDKVITAHEGLHLGRVTCACATDEGQRVVTGGSDGLVNVWGQVKRAHRRHLVLLESLCGHDARVTCVAVSRAFGIAVSGSADKTAIVWDLNRLTYVRQLAGHAEELQAVCVNDASGDIYTCTRSSEIRAWSVNGDCLAVLMPLASAGLAPLTAAAATNCAVWVDGTVLVTGHADGVVALWEMSAGVPSPPGRARVCTIAPPQQRRDWAQQRPALIIEPSRVLVLRLRLRAPVPGVAVTAVRPTPSQKQLLVGLGNGAVMRWSVGELDQLEEVLGL